VCFCEYKDCIFIFAPGSGPCNTSVLPSGRMCVISNFLKSRMLQGFGLRPATLCALGPLARGPPRGPLRSPLPSPGGQPTDELFDLPLYSYCSLPGLVSRGVNPQSPHVLCSRGVNPQSPRVVLSCILTGTVESAKLRIVLWTPRYLPLFNVFMHHPLGVYEPTWVLPYSCLLFL